MLRIAVDLDNILTNSIEAVLQYINRTSQTLVDVIELRSLETLTRRFPETSLFWQTTGVYSVHVTLLPGAVEFIQKLESEYGRENVLISTPSIPETRDEKLELLRSGLGVDASRVVFHHHRWHAFADCILVDDHPGHVVSHIRANSAPGVLLNPENKYGWSRFTTAGVSRVPRALLRHCNSYASAMVEVSKLVEMHYRRLKPDVRVTEVSSA